VLPESFFVWIDSAQKNFKPSPSLGELPEDLPYFAFAFMMPG
jgi:hypothetical protein